MGANRHKMAAQLQYQDRRASPGAYNVRGDLSNRYALRLRLVPQQPVGFPFLDVLELHENPDCLLDLAPRPQCLFKSANLGLKAGVIAAEARASTRLLMMPKERIGSLTTPCAFQSSNAFLVVGLFVADHADDDGTALHTVHGNASNAGFILPGVRAKG